MSHRFALNVYYEDTDMGGIVYYANYLKFIERARSTWVAQLGVDQLALQAEGVVFAVRSIRAEYLAPARLGDLLEVVSHRQSSTPARWILRQEVQRAGQVLFTAEVTIVALTAAGKPTRLPAELRRNSNP
ncbi:MAG: YbgC/FadM family acyl-CoA thioesterase [Planktomarina sp.]|jgi:acyl-CoA thioester hydrolase|nr:YbgC/FadM family acyl-CoA thioesterase [Planktomarina sp.]